MLAAALLLCGGCGTYEEAPADPGLEAVVEHTDSYAGEQVTFEARVERVYSDCALLLSESNWTGGQDVLTVCSTQPPHSSEAPARPERGDRVRVTGTPVEMTRVGFEQRAAVTVEEEIFPKDETMTVLVAETIEPAPERAEF